MNADSDPSLEALRTLVREHAVEFGEFELSSGGTTSVYVDIRQVSLTGRGAEWIGHAFWQRMLDLEPGAGAVGGMSLGADPLVTATTFAARERDSDLCGIIVRKAGKEHGTGRRVEAPEAIPNGAPVVAVDDTTTTGSSTLEAVEQMRKAGFEVDHALSVVDRESGATERLADAGVELDSLFTLSELAEHDKDS
jgi:orotate phosphoribosyltransferase